VLDTVSFEVADLSRLGLGHTSGSIVQIDINAAGYGWFVDATVTTDEESTPLDSSGMILETITDSEAHARMDFLTVVRHELGHTLGFEHTVEEGVMAETLDVGVRCLSEEPILRTTVVAFPNSAASNSAYQSFM
jgi:hypothetical protein